MTNPKCKESSHDESDSFVVSPLKQISSTKGNNNVEMEVFANGELVVHPSTHQQVKNGWLAKNPFRESPGSSEEDLFETSEREKNPVVDK
jgi:hypothetical protein